MSYLRITPLPWLLMKIKRNIRMSLHPIGKSFSFNYHDLGCQTLMSINNHHISISLNKIINSTFISFNILKGDFSKLVFLLKI